MPKKLKLTTVVIYLAVVTLTVALIATIIWFADAIY